MCSSATRRSTDRQDLTAQRNALAALGVATDRVHLDHGVSGRNRDHPGLRGALATCREGDALVVANLDRLERSVPDARSILEELTGRGVKLSSAGTSMTLPIPSAVRSSRPCR